MHSAKAFRLLRAAGICDYHETRWYFYSAAETLSGWQIRLRQREDDGKIVTIDVHVDQVIRHVR